MMSSRSEIGARPVRLSAKPERFLSLCWARLSVLRPLADRMSALQRSHQIRQNPHRLPHLFIRIEKMRRQAQADAGAAVDENFFRRQTLDHPRTVFNVNHH